MKNNLLFNEKIIERLLFWEYNSNYAVRKNNWKLLIKKDNSKELYDLSNDISEKENIYKLYPELVKELSNEIDNWKNNL